MTMHTYTATLPLYALRAALLFAAKKDKREYLFAVHLEADPTHGARVTATDGHALLRVHPAAGTCDGPAGAALLSAAALAALLKAVPKAADRDAPCRVDWATGEGAPAVAAVTIAGLVGSVPLVAGRYPDCTRVIPAHDGSAPPKDAPPGTGTVNHELLKRVADARVLLGVSNREGAPYFAQQASGPQEAVLCDVGAEAVCVVMPYYRDDAVPATDTLRQAWATA